MVESSLGIVYCHSQVAMKFNDDSILVEVPNLIDFFVHCAKIGGDVTCLAPSHRQPPTLTMDFPSAARFLPLPLTLGAGFRTPLQAAALAGRLLGDSKYRQTIRRADATASVGLSGIGLSLESCLY